MVTFTIDNLPFLLINIYGPNLDSPVCYINLLDMNQDIYSNQHIVIGDDFNLVFDKDINNRKSKLDVLKIMDT